MRAFETAKEDSEAPKEELSQLKEILSRVKATDALKTTLDSWPKQWAERSKDKGNLSRILRDASGVRMPMISKWSEASDIIVQILSSEQWKTLDTTCKTYGWVPRASLKSIFPGTNKKYMEFPENGVATEGLDTPLVLRLDGEQLHFSVNEGSNDPREMCEVNDVLFSIVTWKIVDMNEDIVHNDNGEPLFQSSQLLKTGSISDGTVILQKTKKEQIPNNPSNNVSDNDAQESNYERFWDFVQQRLQREAVYGECSGLTMYEIRPVKEGGASLAFGIRRKKIALEQSETTQEIRLLYNRREFPIDDTVFIDPTYFEQWLREFKILEGDEADEDFFSKIKTLPTLNTSISLVRWEGKQQIEIILYKSQSNEGTQSTR